MKILHSSDWHLGKKFFNKTLLPEQLQFLDWLLETLEKENIELFILSGDIFDIPHPPTQAISSFFNFLAKVQKIKNLHSIIIPGNHDSASFIASVKPFLDNSRITIACEIEDVSKPIQLVTDTTVNVTTLPYFRWSDLLNVQGELALERSQEENDEVKILEHLFKKFSPPRSENTYNILVAHHLFGSFMQSGSEQGLHLSGVNSIPLCITAPYFDLLALGHIHRSQVLKKENPLAIYSGAPMPFRFNEVSDKHVLIYNLRENKCEHTFLKIPQFRQFQTLNCTQENWQEQLRINLNDTNNLQQTTYLEICLQLDSPDNFLTEQIKEYAKNFNIELISFRTSLPSSGTEVIQQGPDVETLSAEKLFELYYKSLFGEESEIPKDILNDFSEVIQQCRSGNDTMEVLQ